MIPSLFLEFDPRFPDGLDAYRNQPDELVEVVGWPELLEAAIDSAESAGLDAEAVLSLEHGRDEQSDLNLLHHLSTPAPVRYERSEQLVVRDLIDRLLVAPIVDDALRGSLRDTSELFGYAADHHLWARVGEPGWLEAEQHESLVLVGRTGEPPGEAVMARWPGPGAPSVPAGQVVIDDLITLAARLRIDTAAVGSAEAETRRQPAPGRLRVDEDIEALAELTEAVLSAGGGRAGEAGQQFAALATLLAFAAREHLLLSTSRD